MQTERSLAEGFIGSHPAEAARVLESLPPAQLVVLFNEIPAPLAAACLANLASAKSAEILADTPADRAGRILWRVRPGFDWHRYPCGHSAH